jgi:hypothetical protein
VLSAADLLNSSDGVPAAGRAKTGFAGERDTTLVLATRADVAGITGIGIAAGHETLDNLSDVGTLVGGGFGFQALVAPVIPMVTEYLMKRSWPVG